MTDQDVRIRITASDETRGAFSSASRQVDSFETSMRSAHKASKTLNDIMTGGGLLIAFRTLGNYLGDVSDRYKSSNAAAAEFAKTQTLLKNSFDQGFLKILQAMSPALKAMGEFMDPAALATKRLATATTDLANAEALLAKARKGGPFSGLSAIGGAGANVSDLERQVRDMRGALEVARINLKAQQDAAFAAKNRDVSTSLDPTGGANIVGDILKGIEAEKKAQDAAVADAKRAADDLAKYNEDLVAQRIKTEEDATARINKYNEDTVQARMRTQEAAYEEAAQKAADAQTRAADEAARQSQEIWNNAAKGIQDALTSALEGAFGSASDFFSALRDLAKHTLAEIASGAIMKSASGALLGGASGGGALGTLSSLFSGGIDAALGGWAGGGGALAGATGGSIGGAAAGPGGIFGGSGIFGGGAGLAANLGAGLLGGFAGNAIGSSVFNRTANNTLFSTLGGLVGSFGGPLGSFAGASIGALLDSAVGTDTNGQRVALGVNVGGNATQMGNLPTVRGASGLSLTATGRRTDKTDAQSMLDAFTGIDAMLTAAARTAGITVDLAGKTLTNPAQAGRNVPQTFFGSIAKGQVNKADIDTAASNFIKSWIDALGAAVPPRVKAMLSGADGTADELASAFSAALNIDKLINLDVVNETTKALEELGQANKTLLEQYDAQTKAVVDISSSYDGSVDSILRLSDALTTQKQVAVALAAQYKAVGDQINSTFTSAIDSIRESIMSDEELYNTRRAQIADLNDQLTQTIDPDKISSIIQKIDALTKDAFGLLDDTQKQALAGGFVDTLQKEHDLAQSRIDAGLSGLANREGGVNGAVSLELSMQTSAATTAAATQQFADSVAQFSTLPAQIQAAIAAASGSAFSYSNFSPEVNAVL